MTPKEELYQMMKRKGYPESFAVEVSEMLHTEWTAKRMMGYLSHYPKALPLEEAADEVLAILSDRNRIVEKKIHENTNAKWNEHLQRGLDDVPE